MIIVIVISTGSPEPSEVTLYNFKIRIKDKGFLVDYIRNASLHSVDIVSDPL